MTIEKMFAKYSTAELKERIAKVEERIDEHMARMEAFKAEGNVEFFNVVKDLYDKDIEVLMNAQYALAKRM